jgi:hypothetical protein
LMAISIALLLIPNIMRFIRSRQQA